MKLTTHLLAGLASVGLFASASAQDPVKFEVPGVTAPAKSAPASPAPAPKAAAPAATKPAASAPAVTAAAPAKKTFTDAQIAEAYGWFMGAQMGLRQLEFTKEQVEAMARGMVGVASGAQPPFDAREIGPEVEAFMERKNQAFIGRLRAVQTTEGNAHMTALDGNKSVVKLPSGLRYEIVKPGTGATPKPGQLVSIRYTGALANGQVFDSNVENPEPAEFLLQAASPQSPNGVIPGMFEGLQKTGVGGKLKLHIPPALAYGDDGAPGAIPPGATLVFDIEIVGVKDAPKEPAAK